jgi:hypothetical protein
VCLLRTARLNNHDRNSFFSTIFALLSHSFIDRSIQSPSLLELINEAIEVDCMKRGGLGVFFN